MFIEKPLVDRIMAQSGKSREEVVKLIQTAKTQKKPMKNWADYDPDEPVDPTEFPYLQNFLETPKKPNLKINTNVPRIDNTILNNKDELYKLLVSFLSKNFPDYKTGRNINNTINHTLSYFQELNNNISLPIIFKQSIQRFIEQYKPIQQSTFTPTELDIEIDLPDIQEEEQEPRISEELLSKHIKEIINEHRDVLNILTTKNVITLLEGIFHTDLQNYKPFIKKTIKF